MRKKKDLPLSVLKSLEPYIDLKDERFEVVDPEENLLKVIDKDTSSTFHFTIEKYQKSTNAGIFSFLVTKAPKNHLDNNTFQHWVDDSAINEEFGRWIEVLNEYDNTKSFFDDPIIKSFQEELYAEFEIIDEDAARSPLKINHILILDNYLEAVDNRLTEFITESNSHEITEIKAEINLLRDNLTTKSKRWIANKFSAIGAKIAKQGTKYIREFLTESKKELVRQCIKTTLELVIEKSTDLLP